MENTRYPFQPVLHPSVHLDAVAGNHRPCPPPESITAQDYTNAGLPWFQLHSEVPAQSGSAQLADRETVADHASTIGVPALTDNQTLVDERVAKLRRRLKDGQVREAGWYMPAAD